jgi:hypothetical protein
MDLVSATIVTIEHIGLRTPSISGLNVFRPIDGTKPLDEIKKAIINSVEAHLKPSLFLCPPTITIFDTDGREYILDEYFINKKQPFSTNSDGSQYKKVKVYWDSNTTTRPTLVTQLGMLSYTQHFQLLM